jgi:hypothetical protein
MYVIYEITLCSAPSLRPDSQGAQKPLSRLLDPHPYDKPINSNKKQAFARIGTAPLPSMGQLNDLPILFR